MTGRGASRAARLARTVGICAGLWAADKGAAGLSVRRENGGGRGGGFAGARVDGNNSAAASKGKRGGKAPVRPPDLTPTAKALLDKHQNNIDAASTEYYSCQLQKLTASYGAAGTTSSSTASTLTPEERHLVRLQAAWDAVALFLPVDYQRTGGKVDPFVRRRLSMIAASCCTVDPSRSEGGGGREGEFGGISLLDVGCGDGGIVPYLDRNRITDYLGIDVSPEMIDLGRRRHPKENFVVGCFPDDLLSDSDGPRQKKMLSTAPPSDHSNGFDCVLFNGSLQFFADPKMALSKAKALLRPDARGAGRIVIAHAMGSKFVANECRSNPSVAVSHLPPVETSLRAIAGELGMRILTKQELLREFDHLTLQESDASDSNFYLAALTL